MFSLAIVPIVAVVGASVDYSRANAARTAMQSTLDATALMLSKDAVGLTEPQLNTKANAFFNSQFNRPEVTGLQVNAVLNSPVAGTFTLHVTASGIIKTTFTKVIGVSELPLGSSVDVTWGIKKLELALVLDNTGSMASSGKLTQLKTAAKNLLETLKNAAKQPGDVKVSIIPFDTTVNLGTGYKDEPWIDYTLHGIQKNQWEGCVQDRDKDNDVLDTTPNTAQIKTLFPAVQCGALVTLMPLTDVLDTTGYTALTSKIDAMAASGNTNVTIGLVWGWHSLTSNLPLPQGLDVAPDRDKVIVLLTDGDNTQNRWTSTGSSIDARTSAACTNVKAANIKLYTVRVINGDATLLRNCATKPSMYYDVQQASQLNAVFSSIAQNLANLRLSK